MDTLYKLAVDLTNMPWPAELVAAYGKVYSTWRRHWATELNYQNPEDTFTQELLPKTFDFHKEFLSRILYHNGNSYLESSISGKEFLPKILYFSRELIPRILYSRRNSYLESPIPNAIPT